jgi:hypothetical protein
VATASELVTVADPGQVLIPRGSVGVLYLGDGMAPVPADRADALVSRLRTVPGVTGVADFRWAGTGTPSTQDSTVPVVTRCADLHAVGLGDCTGTAGLDARLLGNGFAQGIGKSTVDTPPDRLPLLGLLVGTDGSRSTMESVRTAIESGPDATWLPFTADEAKAMSHRQADRITRIGDAALLLTLLLAGFSLAVAVAGGLVERKRPFALLRLTGMRPAELRRVVLVETAGPLVATALFSVGLGLAVGADAVRVGRVPWALPGPAYWWTLGVGLVLALLVATAAPVPLLGRLTSLETARFE